MNKFITAGVVVLALAVMGAKPALAGDAKKGTRTSRRRRTRNGRRSARWGRTSSPASTRPSPVPRPPSGRRRAARPSATSA